MTLCHIIFFPHTLPLPSTNFTQKLKLNHNCFLFSPSRSSSSSSVRKSLFSSTTTKISETDESIVSSRLP
uniref:Uncharacterized protein n=1 Tax=Medicago truncatula TaxID=3880 RepID=A2Q612_MEDTR|nr:hypothetical protein MtrDRAFT_AC172742g2v1 [Medicago truncatula]